MSVQEVPVSGGGIKLGQFIKLASLVATGGEAKEAIAGGLVTVNGERETRRGRHLVPGDEVCVDQACAKVADAAQVEDDFFDETTADDGFDPDKWRNL